MAPALTSGWIALAGACVIPPPLRTDEADAGVNHPPVFRSVKTSAGDELVRPGPHQFVVGSGELRITVADVDVDDTLFLRMYLNYGQPRQTPSLSGCEASPGMAREVERSITCPLIGVCTDTEVDGAQRVFEIDLFDRTPISTPDRMYRAVTPPGEIATYWWSITCVEAPP